MHLAEGLLPASCALACAAVALPFVVVGAHRMRRVGVHRVAMATALLFAVTLFPVPVPLAGVSSHMCAVPVLALLLGAWELTLPTALVLLMQALFFAHGGLSTFGANVLTLGVAAPFAAVGIARLLRALRAPVPVAVFVACASADLLVYALDALLLAFALAPVAEGTNMSTRMVAALLLALAPAQLPLALLEGALSVALIKALVQRDADRVPRWLKASPAQALGSGLAVGVTIIVALVSSAPAHASQYAGLDEVVFEQVARDHGRTPRAMLAGQGGELGRALFGGGMLAAGFVLGRGWRRLERGS